MKTPIKPLADRVVAIREKAKEKTASGLYLPDNSKESPVVATVEAIGPKVQDIKVGDKILYKEYSTTQIKLEGTEYLVLKEEDILGIIS